MENFENESLQIEEDIPKQRYNVTQEIHPKNNDTNWITTIKGHYLLGWCVAIFCLIYFFELFKNNGSVSEIGKVILEILKVLTFSLTGYLFGTNGKEK